MVWLLVFLSILLITAQVLSMRFDPTSLRLNIACSKSLTEPGEPFDLIVTLSNPTRVFLPYLRITFHMPEGMNAADPAKQHRRRLVSGSDATMTTWLRPRQELRLRLPVSTDHRGVYRITDVELQAGDFLGLQEKTEHFYVFTEVVTAPQRNESVEIGKLPGSFPGDISVRRYLYEDPMLITGFAEYTGREPMRAISWNATARAGRMLVKQYDHTVEMSVTVLLNTQCYLHDAEAPIELCFKLCRNVCEQLEAKHVRYRVYGNAELYGRTRGLTYAQEGLGDAHTRELLECLGRASSFPANDHTDLLARARGTDCCGIVLITPERDPDLIARTERIASQNGSQLAIFAAEDIR